MDRVVSQLLTEIDGVGSAGGANEIFVIGVLNSCVMLFMKSVFISEICFCMINCFNALV